MTEEPVRTSSALPRPLEGAGGHHAREALARQRDPQPFTEPREIVVEDSAHPVALSPGDLRSLAYLQELLHAVPKTPGYEAVPQRREPGAGENAIRHHA